MENGTCESPNLCIRRSAHRNARYRIYKLKLGYCFPRVHTSCRSDHPPFPASNQLPDGPLRRMLVQRCTAHARRSHSHSDTVSLTLHADQMSSPWARHYREKPVIIPSVARPCELAHVLVSEKASWYVSMFHFHPCPCRLVETASDVLSA